MGNKKQNKLERTRKDPRTKRRTLFKGNKHTSSLKDDVNISMKCISDIGKCQNCGADVIVMHQIDEKMFLPLV